MAIRLRLPAAVVAGVLLSTVTAAPPAPTVRAADEPRPPTITTLSAAAGATERFLDQSGLEVLRVEDGFDLDQYLCRDATPLDFSIDIDRDFGPVDASGHPAAGNALFGTVARLTLRIFDVDEDSGERDTLSVNGTLLDGFLSGANNQWSVQSFEIPAAVLLLPTTSNPDGRNAFAVDIDTQLGGWCVEIDFAELRLGGGTNPVAFLHGITSSGDAMDEIRQHFEVSQQGLIVSQPDFGPIANLEATEDVLRPEVERLLRESGAAQVNVVAHSQGGLRGRLYAWNHPEQIASLTMLGVPNGGSEFASSACAIRGADPILASPRQTSSTPYRRRGARATARTMPSSSSKSTMCAPCSTTRSRIGSAPATAQSPGTMGPNFRRS